MKIVAAIGRGQWNRREECVLVVRDPAVDGNLSALDIVHQGSHKLIALVGGILRVADTVIRAIEAADAAIPAIGDLGTVIKIDAPLVAAADGEPQRAAGIALARLLDEVDGDAGLAARPDRARPAAQNFDTGYRVVDPEQRGIVEERQCRRSIDRRSVDLDADEGRIAAGGETAHLDVGAGDAAGCFGKDPRHDLQQIGGARRRGLANLVGVGRGDGKARVKLAQTVGIDGAGHDDLFYLLLGRGGVAARLLLLLGLRKGWCRRKRTRPYAQCQDAPTRHAIQFFFPSPHLHTPDVGFRHNEMGLTPLR